MKKINWIFSLAVMAFAFSSCSQDSPLAERNQSFVPGVQSEFETDKGECVHYGTVRKVGDELECDYLIVLDNGRMVTPINMEQLGFDLDHRQRVYFGFSEEFPGNRGCLDAIYVSINCLTRIGQGDRNQGEADPTE